MSFLRNMFSGRVKAEDPRRFLIEAMLAAMEADGEVMEEEMEVLQNNLEMHALFEGLTRDETGRFIDLAAESIREAGGGRKRVDAIARGLPSRSHRLTAYAMACEVCVADADLAESEIEMLDQLQEALQLGEEEARELFEAARARSGLLTLEEKTSKMRDLVPRFVDCMALMASADGEVHPEERVGMRAVLRNIPDLAVLGIEELDTAINASFDRIAGKEPAKEIQAIAEVFQNPQDRYWTIVYMMIICLADGETDWREIDFLGASEKAFGMSDSQMDQAMETAKLFPAVELGGKAPI
jgi:uncharacterized tellurite resistance protein B-like protein